MVIDITTEKGILLENWEHRIKQNSAISLLQYFLEPETWLLILCFPLLAGLTTSR